MSAVITTADIEQKSRLIRYQKECYRVLADTFLQSQTAVSPIPNKKSHPFQVAFHLLVGGTRLELVTSTMST